MLVHAIAPGHAGDQWFDLSLSCLFTSGDPNHDFAGGGSAGIKTWAGPYVIGPSQGIRRNTTDFTSPNAGKGRLVGLNVNRTSPAGNSSSPSFVVW